MGLILLISTSFFAGKILKSIFPEWVIGTLGILLIVMAFQDDDNEDRKIK